MTETIGRSCDRSLTVMQAACREKLKQIKGVRNRRPGEAAELAGWAAGTDQQKEKGPARGDGQGLRGLQPKLLTLEERRHERRLYGRVDYRTPGATTQTRNGKCCHADSRDGEKKEAPTEVGA
ncbi:MAG: hypothetical protein WBA73_19840 [Devosia sp.]